MSTHYISIVIFSCSALGRRRRQFGGRSILSSVRRGGGGPGSGVKHDNIVYLLGGKGDVDAVNTRRLDGESLS